MRLDSTGEQFDGPTVTVSLTIDNTYEDGGTLTTEVSDVVIPAPPADEGSDGYYQWGREHISPFTGTGRSTGNSWYDVTVTRSSMPELIGRKLDFGY